MDFYSVNQNSLSSKLHQELAHLIANTSPGDRLPTEPLLARQLGVSRATLREAMRTFETQGMLLRRQGVGTFVLRPALVLESGLEVLESIETVAKRKGLEVSLGRIDVEQREANFDECQALELDEGCRVIWIARVVKTDSRPVAYLIDILPEELLSVEEIENGFSGSVLDLILERGEPRLVNSRCEIAAVAADALVSRALHIQRGDAILKFSSRLYSVEGSVIDRAYSYFLPGYFRFHVVRKLSQT